LGVGGGWFLKQDMFSFCERLQRPLQVKSGGERDVDDINGRVV
jgi:hypothetical protein